MDNNPTPEQLAILDFIRNSSANLMISALAGTGKTTTFELIDATIPTKPHLYLVFGKANATAAQAKFPSSTTIKTINAMGDKIWRDFCSKPVTLNSKKIPEIFRAVVEDLSRAEAAESWARYDQITAGVNLARAVGYIPSAHSKAEKSLRTPHQLYSLLDELPDPTTQSLIDTILLESIRQAYSGVVDFTDQCYMPALFGGFYPRYPIVMVDEYQDLSPVQHILVEKLTRSSRLIGVGDEAQSIYGFRGASAGGMARAIAKFSMAELPLSVSFRCPSKIVENVRWRVPNFRAFRDGGRVEHLPRSNGLSLAPDSTVICRNNAPLLSLAMSCLSSGQSISVSGTDISTRLLRTMAKLGSDSMNQAQTLDAIDQWLDAKLAAQSKSAADTADCMRIFAKKSPSLAAAIAYAKHLFAQYGAISFLTGHKSKGLEFDHVYHLSPELCTNRGQDPNIRYVIDTRAREVLTYI